MRLTKTIPLDNTRAATVRELYVGEVRQLLSAECQITRGLLIDAVRANHAEVEAVLGGAIRLPPGETLDKLPISELLEINIGFVELNQSVFQLAAALDAAQAEQDAERNSSTGSAPI